MRGCLDFFDEKCICYHQTTVSNYDNQSINQSIMKYKYEN